MDAPSQPSEPKSSFRDAEKHLSGLDSQAIAVLLEQASDIAIIIENGLVKDVAIASEELRRTGFAEGWIGRPWVDTVTAESRTKIEALLTTPEGKGPVRPRQVNHPSGGIRDVPVAYRTVRAQARGPLIALGRDLREVADLQQKLVKAQQDIERDYARLRKAEARYKMVFEAVAEPILIVTSDDLLIEAANRAAGKLLDKVLKLSSRVIVPVQPSLFDMLATRQFLEALLEEKAVRKGKADVAVIGMRVDARTRAAGELERFFATFDLPVLAYLRDTQVYVQATAAGMTIFDLPPSRAERDVEQWQAIIDWVERGEPVVGD